MQRKRVAVYQVQEERGRKRRAFRRCGAVWCGPPRGKLDACVGFDPCEERGRDRERAGPGKGE